MNFFDMPTHALNDVNAALWIVFFVSWVIVTPVMQLTKHSRRRAR